MVLNNRLIQKKIVFKHNNLQNLEQILQSLDLSSPKIIIFESVYSMDGKCSTNKRNCRISKAL